MSESFPLEVISESIKKGNYQFALDLMENHSDPMKYYLASRVYELTGYFQKAIDTVSLNINLLKNDTSLDTGKDQQYRLQVIFDIAKAYGFWRLFKFSEGKEILQNHILLTNNLPDIIPDYIGTLYNILGLLFWKNEELDFAEAYFQVALDYRKRKNDPYEVSYTLNNLGNTYLSRGIPDRAEEYYNQSFKIRQQLGYIPSIAASYNSFGRLEDFKGNYENALKHYENCLNLWIKVGNDQFIAKSYRFLAMNAYHMNKKDAALEYIEKSDAMFEKIGNEVDLFSNTKLKEKFGFR